MSARHFLVLDLEATCWEHRRIPREEMEVIELGAVLLDAALEPIAEHRSFVRPERHPRLSDCCMALTGITQAEVDDAPTFPEAFAGLLDALVQGRDPLFCSWGGFDRRLLKSECARHELDWPLGDFHLNLRVAWREWGGGGERQGLREACAAAGVEAVGRGHRALDDARTLARLMPLCLAGRARWQAEPDARQVRPRTLRILAEHGRPPG